MKKNLNISNPVIARLPRYYRCVDELYHDGCDRVSSNTLASRLGLTASQVRQDFSRFGDFGLQGYGYNVGKLRAEIAEILGIGGDRTAVMFGAGNLGRALMRNFDFKRYGFTLAAAFDVLPSLAGTEIDGVPVLHIDEAEGFISSSGADIAVLTVPLAAAAATAEKLVKYGVRGIWNFTNADLRKWGRFVTVEDVRFADSLMTLSYRLERRSPEPEFGFGEDGVPAEEDD